MHDLYNVTHLALLTVSIGAVLWLDQFEVALNLALIAIGLSVLPLILSFWCGADQFRRRVALRRRNETP